MEQKVVQLTESQAQRFIALCDRVNKGEISANQAYKFAQQDGDSEDNKGFAGTFAEWMTFITSNGLLQKEGATQKVEVEEEEKKSYVKPLLITAGVLVVVYIFLKMRNKQQEIQ